MRKKEALFKVVLSAFMGESNIGKPDARIIVREQEEDRIPFLIKENGTVRQLSLKGVSGAIERFCESLDDEYNITAHRSLEMAQSLINRMPITNDEIPLFHFKSKNGLCYHKLSIDPEPGLCPTWDAWLETLNNREALQMFTGSLFYEDSDQSQFLIIYGTGLTGKGAYIRALEKVLGPVMVPKTVKPTKGDKHYFADIAFARVVYFDDYDDPTSFDSGVVKMITGGTRVMVDPKGKAAFPVQLKCKLIFTTNDCPVFTKSKEMMRRVILVETSSDSATALVDQVGFERALEAELPAFIFNCMKLYSAKNQNKKIPIDESSLDIASIDIDAHYGQFWHEIFIQKSDGFVSSNVLASCFARRGISSFKERGKYLKYLKDKYGLVNKPHKIDGKVMRGIRGLNARTEPLVINPDKAYETFISGIQNYDEKKGNVVFMNKDERT